MASKFDEQAKGKYKTVALYLPEKLVEAMDKVAQKYPAMNRSKVAEIAISADLEIMGAMNELEDDSE